MRKILKECNLYEIDNEGNIYKISTGKKLSTKSKQVVLRDNEGWQKTYWLRRIIMNNFHSNPSNYKNVFHIDSNKDNLHPNNLKWTETIYGDPIFDKKMDHYVRSKIAQMIPRCHFKNKAEYRHYGAKGIRVCDEWRNNTLEFVKWSKKNGFYKGAWLMRYDKTKGYNPDNCFWGNKEECFKLNCEMVYDIKEKVKYLHPNTIANQYQISGERVRQIRRGSTLKNCN